MGTPTGKTSSRKKVPSATVSVITLVPMLYSGSVQHGTTVSMSADVQCHSEYVMHVTSMNIPKKVVGSAQDCRVNTFVITYFRRQPVIMFYSWI